MSKKLLSEAQVRRFQSLASIAPLQEMGSYQEEEEQNEVAHKKMEDAHAEGVYKEEPDENMEGIYEEEPMEEMLEEEDDDMDADMDDDGDADVELDEELVERFMDAAKAIQEMADALGGGAADMAPAPMDDMADAPEPAMDAPPADDDAPKDEHEDILEEALSGVNYIPSKEEVVSEVAKRVAKRIMEAKEAQAKLNRALGKN